MICNVVILFGCGGMIGGMMFGFGCVMGEIIVVYLIISMVFKI